MAEPITKIGQYQTGAGLHSSPSDANPHVSVKDASGRIKKHMYPDGSEKVFTY